MHKSLAYVRYFGGLGNQLFQYNFSKYLQANTTATVHMLRSKHQVRKDRNFDLDSFLHFSGEEVRHPPFSIQLHSGLLGNFAANQIDKLGFRIRSYERKPFDLISVSNRKEVFPVTYSGYFQNTALVQAAESSYLDRLIAFTESISSRTRLRLQLDINTPIVHVRRGDLKFPENNWMGTLGEGYFSRALRALDCNPSDVVIFTDDLEAAAYLKDSLGVKRFVGPSETTAWETLSVFSTSLKFVMANSTLSWWGGYLANKKDMRVVMPNQWFRDITRSPASQLNINGVHSVNAEFI
jgi:hypothetical protein